MTSSAASMSVQSAETDTSSAARNSAAREHPAQVRVSSRLHDESANLTLLSDQALADRIRFYDMQMQAAMVLGLTQAAHQHRLHFEAALRERARRPHLVAALEAAMAARIANEPGAAR